MVSIVKKKLVGVAVLDVLDRNPKPRTASSWQEYLDNSCSAWAGLPDESDVKPMTCGALVYLHIGKPDGTTVGSFLKSKTKESQETQSKRQSHRRGYAKKGGHRSFKAATSVSDAPGRVDAATDMSVLMSRARYYANYSFFELTGPDTEPPEPLEKWDVFEELQSKVLDTPEPRVVVQMEMHDGVPGLGLGLWEQHLQQWRTKLEAKGCELRLTTVLQKGSDHLRSYYDHWRKASQKPKNRAHLFLSKGQKGSDGLRDFCDFARLDSNTQTKFLLAGGSARWPKEYQRLEPAADANLLALARKTLSEMFMVGRTEELGKFMTRLNLALGLQGLTVPTEVRAAGAGREEGLGQGG